MFPVGVLRDIIKKRGVYAGSTCPCTLLYACLYTCHCASLESCIFRAHICAHVRPHGYISCIYVCPSIPVYIYVHLYPSICMSIYTRLYVCPSLRLYVCPYACVPTWCTGMRIDNASPSPYACPHACLCRSQLQHHRPENRRRHRRSPRPPSPRKVGRKTKMSPN